tara:strand:- start:32 stop:748 length:717 start_codon:yes stop_codon:yes gene_type:complete
MKLSISNMKVVILAGGLGTRLYELTKVIPKPMVAIIGKPIIHRIIDHYVSHGFRDFYIALGYKGQIIKNYFNKIKINKKISIKCVDTGQKTMTGGRLKRLKPYLKDTFMVSYGDSLSSVNLKKVLANHKRKKKLVSLTAVRPPARFGAIKIVRDKVKYFREKNSLDEGWINGGYFVMEPKFLNLIKNDKTFLEKEPFIKVTKKGQLVAYKHYGFWQCMDSLRDKEILEQKIKNKEHIE